MIDLRMNAINRMLLVFVIAPFIFIARPAKATVIYNLTAPCSPPPFECGPLGVLTTQVTTVTGSLTLDIPISPIAQQWDASDVLAYSFTLDSFQITDANSSLSNVAPSPFTTAAFRPFSAGDGFLVATYDPDHSVFLNITAGGVNLIQGSLTSCDLGTCQTQALAPWSRVAVAPEPASLLLLGSGLAGLGLIRRKKRLPVNTKTKAKN